MRGVVTAADDAGFDLLLDDGSTERVAYDDVAQARTVFEWGGDTKHANDKKSSKRTTSPRATSRKEPVRR